MNALEKFLARSKVSAGGAISAFVDYFAAIAKSQHLEMDDCAIAASKVMLDVLTTISVGEHGGGLSRCIASSGYWCGRDRNGPGLGGCRLSSRPGPPLWVELLAGTCFSALFPIARSCGEKRKRSCGNAVRTKA